MKRIEQNLNIFKKHFVRAMSVLFSILSGILLLVSKEEIGVNSICRAILTFIIIIGLALIWATYRVCFYTKNEIFDTGKGKLVLEYGDLWKKSFQKRSILRKKSKKIVVLSVNTTFDTIVDEDLSKVKKPLVSINTMHGRWLKEMESRKIDKDKLDEAIQSSLEQQGIKPLKKLERSQKERGNLDCFEKGTIAVYEYNNTCFYLIALSEFDENNIARNTKDELIKVIETLIEYYNNYGQGYDLYIPLLGTGRSRTDISPQEALQIMVSYFRIYKERIYGNVNIVIYKKQRNIVSLDV